MSFGGNRELRYTSAERLIASTRNARKEIHVKERPREKWWGGNCLPGYYGFFLVQYYILLTQFNNQLDRDSENKTG